PLKPQAGWAAVKAFAKAMAADMSKAEPDKYLSVATKAKRKGRLFIDYLRNGRGNTAVAPYSTRARPGAAISAPLEWSELRAERRAPILLTVKCAGPIS
ncbi:ATP-dependent DNA ligase, partial [Xylella fastidiosa subsp. multiplex]|nr:ATP-dependent DNA ligase [Xylella fastidiosa subsp. multiplex]